MAQVESKSLISGFVPIMAALIEAEKYMDSNGAWFPEDATNARQTAFLERYSRVRPRLVQLLEHHSRDDQYLFKVESVVSEDIEKVNRFAQETAPNIALATETPRSILARTLRGKYFGVASRMDLTINWVPEGNSTAIIGQNGKKYDGVILSGDAKFYRATGYANPLVEVDAVVADYNVKMIIPDAPIQDDFELVDFCEGVQASPRERISDYGKVAFPESYIDKTPNVSWLEGVQTETNGGQPAILDQAKQVNIFGLNKHCVYSRSVTEVAVAVLGINTRPPYTIDQPFVCFITREGISTPLTAAYIDYPDWRKNSNHTSKNRF